ncbi:hypothetical protein HNP65_001561 [Thermosipho japonicus]|uniref:Uncharacterized protein n=1 Tax=Thermosipho japonicus TaxID=90323 RepID=A0A841GTF3_9BACT|nr:hypothetical protein [Thermosipho japonicus]MBB6063098.1 hypothetical protein [Thermosipho japonicus]
MTLNKKYLFIFLVLILIVVIFFISILNLRKSLEVEVLSSVNVVKIKDYYFNFINVKNVSFFEPYYLKIDGNYSKLGNFSIVEDLEYLGYYDESGTSVVYLRNEKQLLKFDPKQLLLNRYYILNISGNNLVVLDIKDGSIKLIVSKKLGGISDEN